LGYIVYACWLVFGGFVWAGFVLWKLYLRLVCTLCKLWDAQMKLSGFNSVIVVVLIALLAVSLFNTYQIYSNDTRLQNQRDQDLSDLTTALNQTNSNMQTMQDLLNGKITDIGARLPIEQYGCVVYRVWNYVENVSDYLVKDGRSGVVVWNSTDAAWVLNKALAQYGSVFVVADDYNVTSDVVLQNQKNARLDSDGATLFMYGNRLVVLGDSFEYSSYNQVSGFIVVNGTVRVENSFRTTITNMIFENCSVGVELANTNTWTEATRLDTIHFDKCVEGLVFRTNTSRGDCNSTGSYGNTVVSRCYFNLLDNSVAVMVEPLAEFTDGQMDDVRIWIGEFGQFNQTGLVLEGSMYKTMLDGVVFESFADLPLDGALIYGVQIGDDAFQSPLFSEGVNFLGAWSARIFNPAGGWVFGVGGVFKVANIPISVGVGEFGEVHTVEIHPATITTFNTKISVAGTFLSGESVTVRIRLEFLDNVVSGSVEKTFNATGSVWLTNDDFLQLYCSPNVVYCILVDAMVPVASDASVSVDVYGTCS
jgi:type II secretory pathway pseudopilin PulG